MIFSLLGLIICWNSSQKLKKILNYRVLKEMIKDTLEQPDEEIHRVRSGRVTSAAVSVPVELGVPHLPSTWICSPTWKLSEPRFFWIFHINNHFICKQFYFFLPFLSLFPEQGFLVRCWKAVVTGDSPVLYLILASSLSPLSRMLVVGIFVDILYQVRVFPPSLVYWEVLSWMGLGLWQMFFLHIDMIMWFFFSA